MLYICFDESGHEILRDLASVGIRLGAFVKSGVLRMLSIAALARNVEVQYRDIVAQLIEFAPRVLVIDPLSAMLRAGGESGAIDITYRIVQQCKTCGITVFATSLVGKGPIDIESTELHASTVADTWIHLSYTVRAGERNRMLTIVKSRGTGHSNQVRELILGDDDVTLADVYVEEGEVLPGTLRAQREACAAIERQRESEARVGEQLRKQQAAEALSRSILAQQT